MSLLIGDNLVVSIHYKLTDDSGKLLDSSDGSEPLTYLQGAGNIIPGLERELAGKVEGDSMQVRVEAADGYGEINAEMIQTIDKTAFQGVDDIDVGMRFEAQGSDDSAHHVMVTKIEDGKITVDGNHPLAGMTLNFDISIVAVRNATVEEIDHGHAH